MTLGKLLGYDMLIGMDVMNLGDFAVTNKDGRTVFSFRIPSCRCIDFVKEHAFVTGQKLGQPGGGFQGHPHKRRGDKRRR